MGQECHSAAARLCSTQHFGFTRDLTSEEKSYATLHSSAKSDSYYESGNEIGFAYNKGPGSSDDNEYEHNPYAWKTLPANLGPTEGWDLPLNCYQDGGAFLGIPLSRASSSKLQSTNTFQNQFDFEPLIDRNYTYMQSFGTNHGWLVGETIGNGPGSIVDKDTAHIPSKLTPAVCLVSFHSIPFF